MADDIVERLRGWADMLKGGYAQKLTRDAADEIERTRKEVDLKGYRLDDALDEIERLRAVVNEAAAEIKRLRKALELTCRDESAESWDLLMLHYLKEARRG